MSNKDKEFDVVKDFTNKLGLKNRTDGTIPFYKKITNGKQATKPDGYFYYEGITFILDAKAEGKKFTGQLKDYMTNEPNPNFIGFEYNKSELRVYLKGELVASETTVQNKEYYKNTYFPNLKVNNAQKVAEETKNLVDLFWNANIDKQLNVHFIGAIFVIKTLHKDFDKLMQNIFSDNNTISILQRLIQALNKEIDNNDNINKVRTKNYLIRCLEESTIQNASVNDIHNILETIVRIYNNIHLDSDFEGFDIMNRFLQVFRKWNSANANEKGEVFTPDHIAQLMAELIDLSYQDHILDPTCGSGTFLTNALALMVKDVESKLGSNKKKITEEISTIKQSRLIGIEVNEFNATLASVNMMMHNDGSSMIIFDNCFNALSGLTYNKVLMNPPFNQKDHELKFVLETLKFLKIGGLLATIVPKTVLKGKSSKNFFNQDYLKQIFSFCKLEAVISLPDDLFAPNAGVATAIAIFKKNREYDLNLLNQSTTNFEQQSLFINMKDDGFYHPKDNFRYPTSKWNEIRTQVINAYKHKIYDEFLAFEKTVNYNDQLLFENFNSHRPYEVVQSTFVKTIRENLAAKILSGIKIKYNKYNFKDDPDFYNHQVEFKKFKIVELIEKIAIGSEKKSIDRKIENKFKSGIPLIIAKKDNNGVGGLVEQYNQSWKNKIVIINGGDGGGGKTFYCDFEFAATNFVTICDLKPMWQNRFDDNALFYLSTVISERLHKYVNHGLTRKDLNPEIMIKLPVDSQGDLDIKYMSDYIANLKIRNN
ncbi:HsdM family class I SAM-dependent methyltransferase [Mesomycoplasma bovoculi]|uniref:site-specific DNA-methyltransferase (adenine-specific) n=1 Tax=Mesomycoplasma bovoculi M165/69 TaxID=743966 RepID=W5UST0_9BACT|nr:N-6 DNA methylase [Mesomycoplasma bovoculi]AHH45269.1 putative DNA methylase [Mesomycoplasma bovoculi M165/69]